MTDRPTGPTDRQGYGGADERPGASAPVRRYLCWPATSQAAGYDRGAPTYTFVRRADAQRLEARIFAVEISKIVKKVSGLDVILHTQVFGPTNRIYWTVRGIENLDDFQQKAALLLADPEYLGKTGEAIAGEYFIPGSFEDMLLQSVDV